MKSIEYDAITRFVLKIVDQKQNMGRHLIKKFTSNIYYEKVLDLGAGNGDDLLAIRNNNENAQLFAIENYKPCIKELENRNIKYFSLNLENQKLPFGDNEMDLIIANQILEHTKEIFWIFHEISRVLKPGGYFLVGVPNLASLHNRILLLMGKQPSCIYPESAHVRGYTKEGLQRFAKIGKLKIIKTGGSNFYPFPPKIAMILSKVFPSLSVGMFILFQKDNFEYKGEYLKFPVDNKLETNFFTGEHINEK
jgi:ubiquinone/menaquinone biosynthesis C-methylase UbiE